MSQGKRFSRIDLLVIMYFTARETKRHGWVDCEQTYEEFMKYLTTEVTLPRSVLESGLFNTEEADKSRYFTTPKEESFGKFIHRFLAPNEYYNYELHRIETKDSNEIRGK